LRNTLVQIGETRCRSAEHFKAWSQNLGHERVLTTFYSYGAVTSGRQAEIITSLGALSGAEDGLPEEVVRAVIMRPRGGTLSRQGA
jgi:hypothetical protein